MKWEIWYLQPFFANIFCVKNVFLSNFIRTYICENTQGKRSKFQFQVLTFLSLRFFFYFFFFFFALTPYNEVTSCSFPWEWKFLDEPLLMPKGRSARIRESFNFDLKPRKKGQTECCLRYLNISAVRFLRSGQAVYIFGELTRQKWEHWLHPKKACSSAHAHIFYHICRQRSFLLGSPFAWDKK